MSMDGHGEVEGPRASIMALANGFLPTSSPTEPVKTLNRVIRRSRNAPVARSWSRSKSEEAVGGFFAFTF